MAFIYFFSWFMVFLPLPLIILSEFWNSLAPEFILGLFTVSVMAFVFIFSDTETWSAGNWISSIGYIFIFGCVSVYLIFKIVLGN